MKDVLYLEVDEDITSAIDKLSKLSGGSVQVVVPKRSALLQSMINLKLLKKAADDHKKQLVLVTTDRLSTHLAGRVGLAVAAKLGGKSEVPESEIKEPDQTAEEIDGGEEEPAHPPVETLAAEEPIAAKAAEGAAPTMTRRALDSDDAADSTDSAEAAGAASTTEKTSKKSKSKGAKIPDFHALQRRLLWVGLGVVVIVGLLVANYLLSSAKVTIYAKGSAAQTTANFTASPAAATDIPGGVLKAQTIQSTKDLSQQVNATGSQDVGTKASGTMAISNSYDTNSRTLPAGTQFTAQGKSFDSTAAVTVPGAGVSGGHVVPGSASVQVQAEQAGDSYNLAPTGYTITGQPAQVTGQGNQMSGGVSKTITVVAKGDVDSTVSSLLAADKSSGQQALSGKVPKGSRLINETFAQGQTNVSSDPAVGSQASTVTVKVTATYTGLAVSNSDLDALLKDRILKQVGLGDQVYDDGAAGAQFTLTKANADGSQALSVAVTASAGPKIDTAAIIAKIKGRPAGDASDALSSLPGVDHAVINLRPSWSTKLPSRASRIKVTINASGQGG